PHRDAIEDGDGECPVDIDLLRQIGNVVRPHAMALDLSPQRAKLPHYSLEQRRLARSIWSDQSEQLALLDLTVEVMNGWMPLVAEGQVPKGHGHSTGGTSQSNGHSSAQTIASHKTAETKPAMPRRAGTLARSSEGTQPDCLPLVLGLAACECIWCLSN